MRRVIGCFRKFDVEYELKNVNNNLLLRDADPDSANKQDSCGNAGCDRHCIDSR